MITNDSVLDIIQSIISDNVVKPMKGGQYDGCYRIHFSSIFGIMVDSRNITNDNVLGSIMLNGRQYRIEYDTLTMWFTCRPV